MPGPARSPVRTVRKTVRRLLPASGDLEQFVAAIADHRGRPIRIRPCELAADDPSGLWVPLPEFDLLLHASGLSAEHRSAIVCHELAHMLLEHRSQVGKADMAIIGAALGLSIDPVVAVGFFARHGYEEIQESEAEQLATEVSSELARRAASLASREALARDNVSSRLR